MLPPIGKTFAPILVALAALAATPTLAATVYQSATYTGQDTGDYTVIDGRFIGAEFSLSQTTDITAIGAQFGLYPSGDMFGAIIAVDPSTGYPVGDPSNLAATALAHVVFTAPDPAAIVGPLAVAVDAAERLTVTLKAGDYAVIFGSGQFGATGYGTLGDLNTTVGSPVLIQTLYDDTWQPESDTGIRIFVEGTPSAVPEPAAWALMVAGMGLVGAVARRRRTMGAVA